MDTKQTRFIPLKRGDDIKHVDGRTARVVAIESAHVHARLWTEGWTFPGPLVTWRRDQVDPIRPEVYEDEALM